MKARIALVLVAAVAVAVASAVAARASGAFGAAQAPLLRIGEVNSAVSTLDIARDASGNGGTVDDLGMESLLRFAPNGKLIPWLATSYSHPSPNLYIFKLHKGVKFWDGNEMTATDVANALNYYRYPKFRTVVNFNSVRSVTAKDKYTVVATLKHPDASFLTHIPGSVIFEKAFQQAHGEKMGQPGVLIMGTGPWMFDSFDPTSGVELSANPHWWKGQVPYKHISVKWFASETSMALALRSNEIDAVPFVFAPREFATTSGVKVQVAPHCSVWNFGMNTKNGPWADIHVRKAVAYAIDKQGVVKAYGGYVTPAQTLIPKSQLLALASAKQVNALLKSLPQYPYSVAKAKAELAKSKYPNGFSGTMDSFDYGSSLNVAEAVAGSLAKIGINLKVTNIGLAAAIAELTGPRDKIGGNMVPYGCISPDANYYPNVLLGKKAAAQGGFGIANYDPPIVDKLMAEGLAAGNPAKRLAIYGQLLRKLATDVPYVPVINLEAAYAISPKFTWQGYSYFDNLQGPWALAIKPK
jgi:peptide/nickel transport system substrate-binding protein